MRASYIKPRQIKNLLISYAVIILFGYTMCDLAVWMKDDVIPVTEGLMLACWVMIAGLWVMLVVFEKCPVDKFPVDDKPIKIYDMAEEKKTLKSGIIGQAQVIFGGAVQIGVGRVGDDKSTLALGLSELMHPADGPGKEAPSQETYCGVQVSLVFPNFESIRNFREMLNELEYEMKNRIDEEAKAKTEEKD